MTDVPFDQYRPSRFYETDPRDPDAPHLVDNYQGLRPGMAVRYAGPGAPLDGPLTITELVTFDGDDGFTTAILNDGEFETDADNLAPQ
jgi:hypothetical protein